MQKVLMVSLHAQVLQYSKATRRSIMQKLFFKNSILDNFHNLLENMVLEIQIASNTKTSRSNGKR